eukprot:CAMPEP_0204867228 /NCGR_PEP_ID=MMETSP1348-20121228/21514_1 /ASSEMBLY_ACC=CAM_ASM_000700 /TAXON_ID=215587 /ORGANISM="Aplanochytrium stocchinoi, Strain GSBS06" /LENGTH=53 /DNA_ID=CAMNT_0052019535 /DNA_START=130 /DNA_END=288 /DNA_ORIENTATION=+
MSQGDYLPNMSDMQIYSTCYTISGAKENLQSVYQLPNMSEMQRHSTCFTLSGA